MLDSFNTFINNPIVNAVLKSAVNIVQNIARFAQRMSQAASAHAEVSQPTAQLDPGTTTTPEERERLRRQRAEAARQRKLARMEEKFERSIAQTSYKDLRPVSLLDLSEELDNPMYRAIKQVANEGILDITPLSAILAKWGLNEDLDARALEAWYYYGGGGNGNYTVEYNYDPTQRPGGMIFYKYHQVRLFIGIADQSQALDDYVADGNSLPVYPFVDYDSTSAYSGNISSRSHPEAYMQNPDGSLQLDGNNNPIPNPSVTVDNLTTTSFNKEDDWNICGPMTLAAIANAMLRLRGDNIIHPAQALSDLVRLWGVDGETVNIFRAGDSDNKLGTVVRDPSNPTYITDISRLGDAYNLETSYNTITGLTTDDVQAFFEGELGGGRVPMVLINIDSEGIVAKEPHPNDLTNHYVAVTSVQTAPDGQTWVEIYNPYHNQMEYYHIEDFQTAFVSGPNTAISFTNPDYQVPENALPINVADWEPADDSGDIPDRIGGPR